MSQTITENYDETYREVKALLKRAKAAAKQNKARFERNGSSNWAILGDLQKMRYDLEQVVRFIE
jgi:hypothetical protein